MPTPTTVSSRARRKRSIRKGLSGTPERPRLTVFRSNKHIYAQVVDDRSRKALAAASDLQKGLTVEIEKCESKIDRAKVVGSAIAAACKKAGIESVVFDRNGYLYHGRIQALADAAREAGLEF
jgi:large subunit ribosomal protein L18